MNNKIIEKATKLGFCCPYAMLTAYSTQPKNWVARKTKLCERSVKYSYAKLKAGQIKCCGGECNKDCMLVKAAKEKAKK